MKLKFQDIVLKKTEHPFLADEGSYKVKLKEDETLWLCEEAISIWLNMLVKKLCLRMARLKESELRRESGNPERYVYEILPAESI